MVQQPAGELQLPSEVVDVDHPPVIAGLPLRRIVWRRLKRGRVAMAGGCVVLLMVLIALPFGSFGGASEPTAQ